MSSIRFALVGLLCIALFAGNAVAATAKQQSRQHFKQGQLHYKLGRFQEALDSFSLAYEKLPHAAFLFNIGQCHRQLGNHERAVFFWEGYLREKPDARNRTVVEELMKEAKAELARVEAEAQVAREQQARAQELQRKEEELRLAREQAAIDTVAATRVDATTPPLATTVVAEDEEPPVYQRWWFWAAVGGAVVVGTSLTVVALAGGDTKTQLPAGSVGTLDRRALAFGGIPW